ncbi:hypothetical protein NKJ64_30335 [Mesorhizobium sp. M0062]|uniref:hypothetical protein n=1 Tax=Mesorhizobium sp. M0062 TaxID=2956867 RepID=UPI0033363B0E
MLTARRQPMIRGPGMISTGSVPHCGKVDTLRQWSRMPTTKFQAIAGDARVGYVVIELVEFSFRLGVEDNAVLHCLFGFRLLRVMTRLESRKNRLDRDALSRILPELGQARRNLLAQPSLPLRLEILEHT